MFKRIITVSLTLLFASFILIASFLRSSSTSYSFYEAENLAYLQEMEEKASASGEIDIKYFFPYPGRILPDNSFWYLKAFRDKMWLFITTNPQKKAEILLLFSDKRLVSSRLLFEKGKPNIALATLTKAEKYLEESWFQNEENKKRGMDTTSFELRLATAALKHRQELEDLVLMSPEDLKPEVIKTSVYSNNTYKFARDSLLSKGVVPPVSPFDK